MAELVFIGLGLFDEQDLTLRGLNELRSSDKIYAEFYTSKLQNFNQKQFEQQIGKKITVLSRQETEKGIILLDSAAENKTSFIVCGDPMMATTHVDLRIRAIQKGIKTKIIHNASIITAAPGLLGLQNYKFGRTTTIAYPQGNYFPMSPYEVIKENKKNGMHSLILLDIQQDNNQYMTANEAIDLLIQMESHHKKKIITPETIVCVIAQAGSHQPTVIADSINTLQTKEFGPPLHTLVLPGDLHFMEIEALETCAGLPHSIALKLQKL
jgi:diphthine synthase